jgi:HipA-like protein
VNGRHGAVWRDDRRVGTLREDTDRVLRFAYDAAWLHEGGFPVSIHLPLSLGDREVDSSS